MAEETRDIAVEALTKIESHIESCDRRYGEISNRLGMILKIVGWGGAAAFGVMVAMLGYTSTKLIDYISKTAG